MTRTKSFTFNTNQFTPAGRDLLAFAVRDKTAFGLCSIALGAGSVTLAPLVVGTAVSGLVAGTVAAAWQASIGNVASGALISTLQSMTTDGVLKIVGGQSIGLVAAGLAGAVDWAKGLAWAMAVDWAKGADWAKWAQAAGLAGNEAWTQAIQGAEWAAREAIKGSEWAAKEAIKGSEWAAKEAIRGSEWAAKEAINGSEWAAKEAIRGSEWAAREGVQGAGWAANEAVQGTAWAANEAAQGVAWVFRGGWW